MLPLSLCILAPAGGLVGQYISTGLLAFGDVGGFIAIASSNFFKGLKVEMVCSNGTKKWLKDNKIELMIYDDL